MRLAVLLMLAASVSAAETDLSVGWIARNPKVDYAWNSTNPTVEGWPASGSTVTWVAHVRWLGADRLDDVSYRWLVDGNVVQTGTIDFAPQSLVRSELPLTWTFDRRQIVFEIDHENTLAETEERNNRLLVHSNALGVGLYVERTFWEGIRETVKRAKIGATTYDDWMQRQIRRFNEMAAYAIYPDTPHGVIDRWRIDEIHVVEDGALPLVPPYIEARDWGAGPTSFATLYPNVLDHTVDMQWGFPASSLPHYSGGPCATDCPPGQRAWLMTIGTSFIHELGHARTMIDTYAWWLTPESDVIRLDPAPPRRLGGYFATRENGLMNLDWGHIDRYSAVAMNLMTGRRARAGNYNEPWDLGWFLNDLPARNRVRFVRTDGSAIANRTVRIYRPTGETIDVRTLSPYASIFDGTPDLELKTDRDGVVLLPRNPFTDGDIVAYVDRFNGVAIVEIVDGNTRRWAFLDSLQFNLAYWRGETEEATHEVVADGTVCRDALGPSRVTPEPEELVKSAEVRFQFPVEFNGRYTLFYAVNGGEAVRVDVRPPETATTTSVTLTLPPGRIVWWFENANAAVGCLPQRSSQYAFDHIMEAPPRRRAVRP